MELKLHGDGLLLRRPQPSDASAMVVAVRESQPEIGRFLVWAGPDYGMDDAARWCQSASSPEPGYDSFHVFDDAGRLLGGVGLHAQDLRNGKIELGYWTRAGVWGTGVAVRASRLVVDCAFKAMGFIRVELIIALDNAPSLRVAEKLGAEHEAILRSRLRLDHGIVDAHLFSLLKDDAKR